MVDERSEGVVEWWYGRESRVVWDSGVSASDGRGGVEVTDEKILAKLLKEIERLEEGCDRFEGVIEYMPYPKKSRDYLDGQRDVLRRIKAFVEKEYNGKTFDKKSKKC